MRAFLLDRRLVAFLGFALLLKLLVPAGFMPDLNAGSFKLTICSSSGLRNIARMDMSGEAGHTGHHGKSGERDGHDMCPYGAAPHVAIAPLVFILAFIFTSFAVPFIRGDERKAAITSSAAWPRGPPSL